MIGRVAKSEPPGPKTESVTEYTPGLLNVYDGLGSVLVPKPSPKFQNQDVMMPVEVSVKLTNSGAFPVVGAAKKLALGAGIKVDVAV